MSLVVSLSSTDEQIADYRRDGYLIVRQVFAPDEIAMLAGEAEQLAERRELIDVLNIRCRWKDHIETGACTFDCFDPVIDIGPVCRYFASDERLLGVLRGVMQDEPCLFKDKLIFKRPGADGYALHQDYIGWPEFPQTFTTAVIAIDATDAANGATEVFRGAHRSGHLSPSDGNYHELPSSAVDPATSVLLELQPGDVALFSGFMPHRSAANRSDRPRRQLYLSYNAAGDGGDRRTSHYRQFHEWLVGKYAEHGKTGAYFR